MRKVVLSAAVSLDGYIARSNGSVDWLPVEPERDFMAFANTVDVAIMGRKTHDIALTMGGIPQDSLTYYVFSRSKPPGKIGRADYVNTPPKAFVANLREQSGKNIWLMGGGELAREFLKDDVVDLIELTVVPILLGEGIPIFPGGFGQRNFSLTRHQAYKSGQISVSYARASAM